VALAGQWDAGDWRDETFSGYVAAGHGFDGRSSSAHRSVDDARLWITVTAAARARLMLVLDHRQNQLVGDVCSDCRPSTSVLGVGTIGQHTGNQRPIAEWWWIMAVNG
jgi:hypothetical protein